MAAVDLYKSLPQINGQRYKFTSKEPFTPSLIRTYLPHAPPDTYSTRLENQKIQLDNPPKHSADKAKRLARKERRKKQQEKKKETIMSKRKVLELGIWNFDKKLAKWDLFWPIHLMWESYMAEVMNLEPRPKDQDLPKNPLLPPNTAAMQMKLVKADFHGCLIKVSDCRNKSRIACEGIVVHETGNTFKVVTRKNQLKVLPKQGTVFTFSRPLYAPSQHSQTNDPRVELELYGNQFRFRAGERAGKKFKAKETIEL